MKNDGEKDALRRVLGRETPCLRLEETVQLCLRQMGERPDAAAQPRSGFWAFLADIFRFEGIPILAGQAAALALAALHVYGAAQDLRYVPAHIPLFVLAAVPVLFRGRYCRTDELEAVTRASAAQLTLAKMLLAGAADLVCLTLLLGLQVHLTGSARQMGRMILYCLVPYLAGMTVLLKLLRRRRNDGLALSAAAAVGSMLFWYGSARFCPWLYEIPAVGAWIAAFCVFTAFFAGEICHIIRSDREGKIYGIVA